MADRIRLTGRVVANPNPDHDCALGISYHWSDDPDQGTPPGWYADIPSQRTHPAGTVWECQCGRTWVAKLPRWDNAPGDVSWRREHWWERRRRQRREGGER